MQRATAQTGALPPRLLALVLKTLTLALVFAAIVAIAPANANPKYAGIVIDANTGKTLYDYRADNTRYPASLTKMMTVYMMFEAMQTGQLKPSTPIRISRHAASMVPSKLGIPAGGTITAEAAILSLVTKSANDVAAAVAEHLGGTESQFARMMTRKARALGMKSTTFRNASGLPNSGQVTTARDMARLGIALQEHFPDKFRYFSTRSFEYAGTTHRNHNRLLGRIKGVDGIKTGYIRASGFNLVTSVNTGGRSIVAVVMGGRTGASRNAQMEKLVAEYLPRASRRDRGPLIAKRGATRFAIRGASIASVPTSRLPVPSLAARSQTVAEKPLLNAYAAAPKRAAGSVDPITTASAAPRTGWVIQIGALESEGQALDYLSTAQSRAASVLGGRDPFIEVFVKSGVTYHRARFAGFGSKSEAWGACESLKAYDYACLAYQL
ncbi:MULTISPECIES: D-alanyl-D-alanine carboxypeptidase [unclassified Roseitalea]|uniref:D-alanyl-D-alanine carboxypeptidase n=1 Tax=unclassified Roseitalea TaxID=2639107 RepID=UPI00273F7ED2|nr:MULTISPECIES: D-alanyl-D-alanine carboxypeptidase [unclassified Roseitalea]